MKKNSFYIQFIYDKQSFSGKEVSYFLKNILKKFNPVEMFGYNTFNSHSYEIIEEEDFKFRALSIYSDKQEVFNISPMFQNRLVPRRFYTGIRFIRKIFSLENDELMYLLNLGVVKIGYMLNNEYHFAQSDDNPQSYKHINIGKYDLTEQDIKDFGMPLYFNENAQMYRIDISQNPGRERFLPGMKFIPAYKIWYGKEAQDLFGKQKILDYQNAIYVKELENGVIEMQLMDDINKCDLPYNQEKQRDIVKYFEIEKLEVPKR